MKREDLPLVTPAQFRKFKPCWLDDAEGRARFRRVAAQRTEWNALDVLDLEDVSARDKLWSVLREAFLPPMLLHEFGCRCAEYALSIVENPDPRSVEAIRVKRRWMTGAATDDELRFARMAAQSAEDEACGAAWLAGRAAVWSAEWSAEMASWLAAAWASPAARAAGRKSAREQEVAMLRALIAEWGEQQ